MVAKTCGRGQAKIHGKCVNQLFKCMVIRRSGTDNEQIGHEVLSADDIIGTVDARLGGNYLTVYGVKGLEKLTPITLEYKSDARKWARLIKGG